MTEVENPAEPFKRAVSAALRALAKERELVVSFGGDDAGMAKDGEARLPQPTNDLKPGEVARVRGVADSLAMRMRYHDDSIHARRRPRGDVAQAIYDSVEQARVESLGMRRFAGVADNVASMLDARCRSRGYERIDRFEDVPLHEAIGFLVREQVTGAEPPESVRKMVDMCRSWIDSKAPETLDDMARDADDQDLFGRDLRTGGWRVAGNRRHVLVFDGKKQLPRVGPLLQGPEAASPSRPVLSSDKRGYAKMASPTICGHDGRCRYGRK